MDDLMESLAVNIRKTMEQQKQEKNVEVQAEDKADSPGTPVKTTTHHLRQLSAGGPGGSDILKSSKWHSSKVKSHLGMSEQRGTGFKP